jgi:hypothetical protein
MGISLSLEGVGGGQGKNRNKIIPSEFEERVV